MRRLFGVCFLFFLAWPLVAQQVPQNKMRGKYLRTEVRGRESRETFEVTMVQGKSSFPRFVFRKVLILTLHEVKLYETVVETVTVNATGGITPRGAVDYVVIPGEIFEGEHNERKEKHYGGEMKMEPFTFKDKTFVTDENGTWTDEEQVVLSMFDAMNIKSVNLLFKHKQYGDAILTLTRDIIKRETPKMPGADFNQPVDMLEMLGIDCTRLKQSSDNDLSVQVTCKENAKPGEVVALTIEAKNNGKQSVSNLLGRSFSSAPELSDKLFYYGLLAPGQKRSFSRLLTMPQNKGLCYVRVAFWCINGTLKNIATDVCISVE